MFIYLLMIGLVGLVSFVYMQFPYVLSRKENTALIGPYAKRCYFHPMFILILAILLFPYVVRYYVGSDFDAYYKFFDWYKDYSLSQIMEMRDFGYYILQVIDYRISKGNWYYHTLIIGILTYLPIVYYYVRYSNNVTYTLLIYILFMGYFSSYNAVRQTLAASFLVIAFMLVMEKKYAKTIIAVFIAYSFHSTVLLILPLLVLGFFDYRKKIANVLKIALLFSAFALRSLWERIINFLYNIGQTKLAEDYGDVDLSGANGAHILRVAVYIVPVVLSIYYGSKIFESVKQKYGEASPMVMHVNFLINASQFALIFMVASQSHWIFARFTSYFSVFIPVLLSFVYPAVKKQLRSLFCIVSVMLFFLYMCMILPVQSDLLPFKTEFGWYFR